MTNKVLNACPVCGANDFLSHEVLWPELVSSWHLSDYETGYINRQQGFHCSSCHNNLRAMGLASAIKQEYSYKGTLKDFCLNNSKLNVLEINRAGNLTDFLNKISGHRLIEYPEFDMENMDIPSASIDLVVHSDTLEHVPNPERGLSECLRVLKNDGKCIFTVPIIVDRFTRSRTGLPPSYHGQSGVLADDQVVYTEFGADAWRFPIRAGFSSCEIYAFEYPAALVLIARK